MTLWVDPIQGQYGLEAQKGFMDRDDKAVDYTVDEKLDIEVTEGGLNRAQMSQEQQLRRRTVGGSRNTQSEIRFAPDGSVDVASPRTVCIRETAQKERALWVTLAENLKGYEVLNEKPNRSR